MVKNYCLHCMWEKQTPDEVCAHCGHADCENSADQLKAGTCLNGRYLVGRCIGQGGFGITYIGRDTILDTVVAIKEYYPADIVHREPDGAVIVHSENPEDRESFDNGRAHFLREARTLAKFKNDPSIVGVWDITEANDTVYIIMEYVEGMTLRQYVKQNGTMTFAKAYDLLLPLMPALEKIHAEGLVHRDISPSNIMLNDDGRVKLLDFGAARDFRNEDARSIVLKPGYSPEEQYRPNAELGPYTDVYSFCATIYYLLTGQVPDNAMSRVLGDNLRLPHMLGAEIGEKEERALMKGLSVFAGDRIRSMPELRDAFQNGVPSAAAPVYEDDDDEKTVAVGSTGTQPRRASPPERPDVRQPVQPAEKREPEERSAVSEKRKPERRRVTHEERPPKAARSRFPKKVIPVIGAVVLAAVLGIIVFLVSGRGVKGADQYEAGSTVVAFRDEVITDGMIRSIRNRKEICSVYFSQCEIGDAQIETLTELDGQVTTIDLSSCTGYTTLDPLAEMDSLTILQLSGINWDFTDDSGDLAFSGSTVFTVDFPQLQYLLLQNFKFGGDTAFLSHFPNLRSLTISGEGVTELDSIICEETLKTLHIYETDLSQVDLSYLAAFADMQEVSLENCACGDISWISGMSALRTIDLKGNDLSSIPMLSTSDLQYVDVSDNRLTDLNWLPAQDSGYLSFYADNNQISDISALAQAPGLVGFQAINNQITDISALADKTSLRTLYLDNNRITNADPLAGDTALERLSVSQNQLENLDFCENITTLTHLSADHNAITDISGLVNTTQLEEVNLSDNNITDASVLGKSAAHLQIVILDNNQIADISMLNGATELTTLSIDHNALTSLNGLESSTKLYALSACGNALTDISALSGMTSLYLADLGENRLTDISALSSVNVSKMALLLENNQISNISMLNVDCDYTYLALYNNKIKDYSVLMGNTTIRAYDYLYISWDEQADFLGAAASKYEYNIYVIDAPLDQQQELINMFDEAKEEYQERTWAADPSFLTTEEADLQIDAHRQELREDCGLTVDTDQ